MLTETQARELLGLPEKDPRVDFQVDWDGREFKDSECDYDTHGPATAAVFVDWTRPGFDPDTDRPNSLTLDEGAYCWEHAVAEIADALDETAPFAHDDEVYIKVVVNGWYLRYAMPTQVAA